ncbi:hypothetical protein ABWH93_10820 [Seohaeicola saemankumensis]|uniref:capsular polysaccharide export protein, LipB/KpsS family n=1 Tax=Seohaeicola TaxID=481178 RepID=UPI0035CF8C6E
MTFYLDDGLRESAEAVEHNFIAKVSSVLRNAGFDVVYRANSQAARLSSALRPGYAMFHMDQPTHPRALTMRRVYHYPFWQIETTTERWNWAVAKTPFDPETVEPKEARRFHGFWRRRLFPDAPPVSLEGFVYVPLQGRLTECRSFQAASPVEMVEAVLRHDTSRLVIATFHPGETYGDAERQAIYSLAERHPRLSVKTGSMERLLPGCDYVVTQNSSAAFNGILFEKPFILFGKSDFHHIGANVQALGQSEAFRTVTEHVPDFAAYLWWFWQEMSINAGRDEAEAKIAAAFARGGWPI